MGALLQLERFDHGPEEPPPALYLQADLDAAFQRGLAEGRADAGAQQAGALCAALDALSAQLAADRAERSASATAALRATAPLIGALLEGVVPAAARARLEASLLEELLDLARAVPPQVARVRCGGGLAPFAAACLEAAGLAGIALDPTGPEGTAEVELQDGLVAWDLTAIAARLRELVHETMELE